MALAAVLLVVPLTGCLGGPTCGPTYTASWHEPGLYEALDEAPGRDDLYRLEPGLPGDRHRWLPEGELAFDRALGDVSADQVALLEVAYRSNGTGREADQASLRALDAEDADRAQLRLEVWGNRSREQLGRLFDPLVGNLTDVDQVTRERWLGDLTDERRQGAVVVQPGQDGARSRQVQWVYTLNMTADWTPERVLDRHIAPDGELPPLSQGPGQARFVRGNWSLSFWPDAWTATFTGEDPPLVLETDVFDRVELTREDGLWENASRTQAWANQTFAEAGLPAPTFQAWRYSATVC